MLATITPRLRFTAAYNLQVSMTYWFISYYCFKHKVLGLLCAAPYTFATTSQHAIYPLSSGYWDHIPHHCHCKADLRKQVCALYYTLRRS